MLEAMPSSDSVRSRRKCRRSPNMTSRSTIRLQRSPRTSTAALIGQPERGSSVMGPLLKSDCILQLLHASLRVIANCNSYFEETDPVRKLISFIGISLDGYYQGPNGEFDFANVDQEFYDFSNRQDAYIDTLMFGRETYELMAAYWPTATEDDPEVIEFMNSV